MYRQPGKYSKKVDKKKIIFLCVIVVFIIVFSVCAYFVVNTLMEYKANEKAYEDLSQIAVMTKPSIPPMLDLDEEKEPEKPKEYAPITVDFETLREEGPDIIGWLYLPDSIINYPVVQSADNNYYLYKLPNGKPNSGGSIFMDYSDEPTMTEYNTVFYGHNMKNGSMFAEMHKYREQEYYDQHKVIYYLTDEQDYAIDLIGAYVTPSTSECYGEPDTVEDRIRMAQTAIDNSFFDAGIEVQEDRKLVTFSTCTHEFEKARFVVVGYLRELDMRTSEEIATMQTEPIQ